MELGNGYQAIYGQLTDLDVAEGDTVTKGSIIGYVCSSYHLLQRRRQ